MIRLVTLDALQCTLERIENNQPYHTTLLTTEILTIQTVIYTLTLNNEITSVIYRNKNFLSGYCADIFLQQTCSLKVCPVNFREFI